MLKFSTAFMVVLALGCGSKKDVDKGGKTDTTKAPITEPVAPVVKSPMDMFTSAKPGLPEPLAKLAIGMPVTEAAAATPGGKLDSITKLDDYQDVEFMVDTDATKEKVRVIQVFLKKMALADVKTALDAKWGPAKATKFSSEDRLLWDNPEGGWRVHARQRLATQTELVFENIMPAASFMTADGVFGFESSGKLLGMSVEDALKLPGAKLNQAKDGVLIDNLPTEQSNSSRSALLRLVDGKVASWQITLLPDLDPKGAENTKSALVARFGEPTRDKMNYDNYPGKGNGEKARVDMSHEADWQDWGFTLFVTPAK